MRQKYSCYEFEVIQDFNETWIYKIFGSGCLPYDDGVIDSDEWFYSELTAQVGAILHIDRLESGEN